MRSNSFNGRCYRRVDGTRFKPTDAVKVAPTRVSREG